MSRTLAKVCSHATCTHLTPCPEHGKPAWSGSKRRERMGNKSGWEQGRQRLMVLYRDDGICHVCHRPGADQVDHIIAVTEGGTDTISNMAPIHEKPCHEVKTLAEAERARKR